MESFRTVERFPDIAYFYPEPVWTNRLDGGNLIKNLALFFDGIAILLPSYIDDHPFIHNPMVAYGLYNLGVLKILRPEHLIDQRAIGEMVSFILPLLESGRLNAPNREDYQFDYLPHSRLGYSANHELFLTLYDALKERGLAKEPNDGISFPIENKVRSLILIIWSQFLRSPGRRMGMQFHPTTDRHDVHETLRDFLEIPTLPSAGHIVNLGLHSIGANLANIPTDEVISFKRENDELYRSYRRSIEMFMLDARNDSMEDAQSRLSVRREEMEEISESIKTNLVNAWAVPTTVGMDFIGAAWTVFQGADDDQEALESGLSLTGGLAQSASRNMGMYSYLFQTQ